MLFILNCKLLLLLLLFCYVVLYLFLEGSMFCILKLDPWAWSIVLLIIACRFWPNFLAFMLLKQLICWFAEALKVLSSCIFVNHFQSSYLLTSDKKRYIYFFKKVAHDWFPNLVVATPSILVTFLRNLVVWWITGYIFFNRHFLVLHLKKTFLDRYAK